LILIVGTRVRSATLRVPAEHQGLFALEVLLKVDLFARESLELCLRGSPPGFRT
jgi:hypothetical protein